MQRRAGVILVGTGRMGHIRAALVRANPRFDLRGIVDIDMENATLLADKYMTKAFPSISHAIEYHRHPTSSHSSEPQTHDNKQHQPSITSSSTLSTANKLQSKQITPPLLDGVLISTPTFTHDDLIHEATNHRLSVFVEKPVDDTAAKIADIFSLTESAGVRLCCGFQRRFDDSYVATKRNVSEGRIGRPIMAHVTFADHPCPAVEFLIKGGDIFSDLSAHDVDYVRWCLDDEVETVYAVGSSSRRELEEVGVHDNATMVMTFKRGAVVTLFMSRNATYGYDQRCEIFGDKGLTSVSNISAHSTVLSDETGIQHGKLQYSFPQRFNQAFANELDAFADTLLLGKEWPVTKDDCIAVLKISDAAKRSCELGRAVRIDEV